MEEQLVWDLLLLFNRLACIPYRQSQFAIVSAPEASGAVSTEEPWTGWLIVDGDRHHMAFARGNQSFSPLEGTVVTGVRAEDAYLFVVPYEESDLELLIEERGQIIGLTKPDQRGCVRRVEAKITPDAKGQIRLEHFEDLTGTLYRITAGSNSGGVVSGDCKR